MKKTLILFILVVLFGSTSLYAQTIVSANGGEFAKISNYIDILGGTWTRTASKTGAYAPEELSSVLTELHNHAVRPGYTVVEKFWESDLINNYQALYDLDGNLLPNVIDCSNGPVSIQGHKFTEFTLNFWAYMEKDTDWDTFGPKGMKLISCTESGGWCIGTSSNDVNGQIQFSGFYNCKGDNKYYNIQLKTKWADLSAGWHMFTLVVFKEAANKYWMAGYLDGGPVKYNQTRTAKAFRIVGGSTDNGFPNAITYNSKTSIMIGGEPNSSNECVDNEFTGKIRNLCIMEKGYRRCDAGTDETNRKAMDTMLRIWYGDNDEDDKHEGAPNNKIYVDTEKSHTIKAIWKANAETKATLTSNFPDEATGERTNAWFWNTAQDNTLTSYSAYSGLRKEMREPVLKDYLFAYWSSEVNSDGTNGYGADYISKYQGFLPEALRKRPAAGGRTEVVDFDGETTYYAINKGKKWSKNFTINVWAWMENWSNFTSSEGQGMRLFSCTHDGGFNIETPEKDANGIIRFAGYDSKSGDENASEAGYKLATSSVKWASLNNTGTDENKTGEKGNWHMFTYVFDGKYVRGYLDGELIAFSNKYIGNMGYNEYNTIFVGAEAAASTTDPEPDEKFPFFQGKMRDFCIMHTALTPSLVKNLYDQPDKTKYFFAPKETTIQANWQALPLLQADNIVPTEGFVGESYTQTIDNIVGNGYIIPDVTIDGTGWTVSKTNLTVDGGSVEITYAPTAVGEHNAKITVSSEYSTTFNGVANKGKAYRKFTYEKPVTVKHVWKGDIDNQELEIVGDGWTKPNASLDVTNPFSINTDAVTKDNGKAILTYAPKSSGVHKAKLTVQSNSDYVPNKITEEVALEYHAHEFDVAYWNDEGFTVKLDDELRETTTISFNGKTVTLNPDRNDTYFFPVDNIKDLETKDITFTGTDWSLSKRIKVKYINGEGVNATDETHDAMTDVIVATGKQLVHNDATERTIHNLYVKPSATFNVEDGTNYSANTIFLYSEKHNAPQLIIPSGGTMQVTKDNPIIYFVKRIPNDRYYELSLPFDCKISDIFLTDGTNNKRGVDWEVMTYDGAARVENKGYADNWKPITDDYLYAGRGYVVAIEMLPGSPAGTMRELVFPMKITSTDAANLSVYDSNEKNIPVKAHGAGRTDRTPNHLGWNFVGNPYFSTYGYTNNEDMSIIKKGTLEIDKWVNTEYIYLTTISKTYYGTYDQQIYTNTKIPPFSAFFIQVGKNDGSNVDLSGDLHLKYLPNSRNPQYLAPRRANENKPIYAGLKLSNGKANDETSLVIGNQYTQAYEIGSDLEKMLGLSTRPQVYVNDANYKYAFKSLNKDDAAQPNDLGVYLPAEGEYTFSIKDSYDLSRVQALYLTDKDKNITVDLMQQDYTFTSKRIHTTARFCISTILGAETTTSLSNTTATWAVWQDAPLHIRLQGVNMGDDVRIFDSTGKLVEQTTTYDTQAAFDMPTVGTYCIQIVGTNGTHTKKIIIQ